MSITAFFIRRAVTTTLLMVALLGFGLFSYFALPVSDLPPVEYPTIQVTANLPGANPDIMASSVATPLEKAFSNIAGVESMSSVNTTPPPASRCSLTSAAASMSTRKTCSRPSRAPPGNCPATCSRRPGSAR